MAEKGTFGFGRAASVIRVADGSVTVPSITFANDLDTGFYRISADRVGYASAGVLSLALDTGGQIQGALATTSLLLTGAADSAAARNIVYQTNNAAGTGLVTRLTIGSNAATATVTWANVNHDFGSGTVAIAGVATITASPILRSTGVNTAMRIGVSNNDDTQYIILLSGRSGDTNNRLLFPTSGNLIIGYSAFDTSGVSAVATFGATGITLGQSAVTGTIVGSATAPDSLSISGAVTAGAPLQRDIIIRTGDAVNPQALATRVTFGSNAATAAITWVNSYHVTLKYGLAGTATGAFTMDGATSGVVTITVAAAAGTYTMTLPPGANSNAGYQLTCAAADTITTWAAAASLRALKDFLPRSEWLKPVDALKRLLEVEVPAWHYKQGKGTQDSETLYNGVVSEDAPWAMHHKAGIISEANAFGHTILSIQALYSELQDAIKEIAGLKGQVALLSR